MTTFSLGIKYTDVHVLRDLFSLQLLAGVQTVNPQIEDEIYGPTYG